MTNDELIGQGLEQLHCSSCGAAIATEDVNEGRARQVGGKIFCASCIDIHAKVEAIKCRKCGAHEPPLFDGKNYLCRACGAFLRNEKRVAAVGDEGRKVPVQLCPYCNEVVGLGARRCAACGARLIGSRRPAGGLKLKEYLIGAAAAAAIFLLAILIRSKEAPTQQELNAKLEKIEQRIDLAIRGQNKSINDYKDEMETHVAKAIATKMYRLEDRLDELEKRAVTAAPPAENKDDTPTLDAIISDRTNPEDDTQPTKPPVEPVNAITPDDGTAAPQEATNDDPPPDESGLPDETPAAADADIAPPGLDIGAIVAELKKEAEKLVAENHFSKAIAMLESRPDIREPLWQADRELMRRKIHKLAGDFHTLDVARARRMVREGRIEDARKLYRQIIVYGMPDMVRDAEIRVTALAGMPDKQPEPDADAPPAEPQPEEGAPPDDGDPRVAKCIAQLSDRDAAHHVRTSAAKKLGELRAKAAVDALIAAMDARDWYLRVCAANALEQIGDVRAVPALINNLDHTMIPVNQVARKALVKLTGNDFGMDGRKWQEWWNAEGMAKLTEVEREKIDNADPPEVIEIPAEPASFASQIVLFKEDQQSVTFTVNANSGLSIGQKVDLKRNDKAVATVEIAVLAHGTATARLVEVAPDTTLKAGDMVGVHK